MFGAGEYPGPQFADQDMMYLFYRAGIASRTPILDQGTQSKIRQTFRWTKDAQTIIDAANRAKAKIDNCMN